MGEVITDSFLECGDNLTSWKLSSWRESASRDAELLMELMSELVVGSSQ
jgi:hypothetical protein